MTEYHGQKLDVLLADTHFGVRGEVASFHDNNERFFTEIFWPKMNELAIDNTVKIIHVGDVFDNRRKLDINTAKRSREYFFDILEDGPLSMDIIAGNHDLYWREQSHTTVLEEVLSQYESVKIFTETTQVADKLYVPWINRANRESTLEKIAASDAKYVFGHLELMGYYMYRGQLMKHGDDPKIFEKFKHVYSGHFHHKNTKGNITYLGSNQQHTWADAGDTRGFHIFTKGHLDFVANPFNMFETIDYAEQDASEFDVKNKHIRVKYGNLGKKSKLDAFVRELEAKNALSVVTIPDKITVSTLTSEKEEEPVFDVEDTVSLFKSLIDDTEVFDEMISLYNQAQLEMRD